MFIYFDIYIYIYINIYIYIYIYVCIYIYIYWSKQFFVRKFNRTVYIKTILKLSTVTHLRSLSLVAIGQPGCPEFILKRCKRICLAAAAPALAIRCWSVKHSKLSASDSHFKPLFCRRGFRPECSSHCIIARLHMSTNFFYLRKYLLFHYDSRNIFYLCS